jgi:peptidoglycan/xylan/chitin deacetylase (PgdA/CDA1 family)
MRLYDVALWALERHRLLPMNALRPLLAAALTGANVALCLHRVRMRADITSPTSDTLIEPAELDALIELLLAARPRDESARWLTVAFDDGYADAGEYVASRHDRFPGVDWLLFVCPAKIAKRAGFRWDLPNGATRVSAFGPPYDIAAENERADLLALGDQPGFRLMTVEECRAVARLPNVRIGNHTNAHFKQAVLPLEVARADLAASHREFEELFGRTDDFAFPFGTPGVEFGEDHVVMARSLGYRRIWSTEPRPYAHEERSGVVLPRFPIYGSWPAAKSALLIAMHAAKWRVSRPEARDDRLEGRARRRTQAPADRTVGRAMRGSEG